MLSDLLYLFVIIVIFITGFQRPHIALMGVVWVDVFKPHNFSSSFLSSAPLSMICSLFFIMTFILNANKLNKSFEKKALFWVISFMCWITITTLLSIIPELAWDKWDWAFKTLFISCFIPFVLNTKAKLDLFLGIWLASISFYFITAGVKTMFGGGGYGLYLIDTAKDKSGLVESSTLSMVSAFCLPIFIYLYRHAAYVNKIPFLKHIIIGVGISSILTIIGTQARTGLLSLGVFFGNAVLLSQNKIRNFFLIGLVIIIAIPFTPDSWTQRMSSIGNSKTESSAHGRVVVWRWTVDFANDNPIFGGGFLAYVFNAGQLKMYSSSDEVVIDNPYGKAFHNIIFEVLGEHGYVGLILYLLLIVTTWKNCQTVIKSSSLGKWDYELGLALKISLYVYCVGGMFIGVAYQIWLPYLLMLSTSTLYISNKERNCNI
jgi:probable O-glycosylation ligase (exosortase A-associated)